MPELRKDIINSNYVIFSSQRGKRPNDYKDKNQPCPFCPGNEFDTPPEIFSVKDKHNNWKIRVVSNKYPALTKVKDIEDNKNNLYEKISGFGIHEVIIETPCHNQEIEKLDINDILEIFDVYSRRFEALKKEKGIKQVIIFKNHGEYAGASLKHPHSQVVAMPILTEKAKKEIFNLKKYFSKNKSCAFCDMIRMEQKENKRIIEENEDFIAFEPFASRFCFETWILPKRHLCDFESQENNLKSLVNIYKKTMNKLSFSIKDISYNMIIYSSPTGLKNKKFFHWRIEILPKLARLAGFEWGSGFYINSISPEKAAQILNQGLTQK